MRLVIAFIGIIFLGACAKKANEMPLQPSTLDGETLAKMHCGSCHAYVEPQMLDKKTWETKTLPEMGLRLGIGDVFSKNVMHMQLGNENITEATVYPLTPKLHEEDYEKIVKFILENAPEQPLPIVRDSPINTLKAFEFKTLLKNENSTANITAITFWNNLIVSGSPKGKLVYMKPSGMQKDSLFLPSVFSVLKPSNDGLLGLDLGKLGPHERKLGKLMNVSTKEEILTGLHKPADFEILDVNEDGTLDYVVCNFGFETGNLSWYDGISKKENLIKNIAGARNVYVEDINQDGKKDLVVLYAQALEGVSIFYNKGKGKFIEEKILEFSPVYGSSWIQIVDFNQDGKLDILYVNGDNADYSGTLKNYHGVRIFENQGKFVETFFYPLYGATKALAADFDKDGDLDIAVIAYYRKDAAEGFVYLENKGGDFFEAFSKSEISKGQWMTLEIADINNDGKPDILLGGHDLARRNIAGKDGVELAVLLNKY